jgi:hypothetical protein
VTKSGDDEQRSEMQALARRSEREAEERLPGAGPPQVPPFPPRVVAGLWLSILLGALLGLVLGGLLRSNTIVVPGWEGLYSMGPFTFHVFWLFAGAALGILVAAFLILLSGPSRHGDEQRTAAGHRTPSAHQKEGST